MVNTGQIILSFIVLDYIIQLLMILFFKTVMLIIDFRRSTNKNKQNINE